MLYVSNVPRYPSSKTPIPSGLCPLLWLRTSTFGSLDRLTLAPDILTRLTIFFKGLVQDSEDVQVLQ